MSFPADYASKELCKLVRLYEAIHWAQKEASCFIEVLYIVVHSDQAYWNSSNKKLLVRGFSTFEQIHS